jgi:DNA-binding MarR family transcriptional regulator
MAALARHLAAAPSPTNDTGSIIEGPQHRAGRLLVKEQATEDGMAVDIRPAQAIKLLYDFAHALVTDAEPDLSARQLAILLTIYLDPPPHTVRRLATKLGVTKPVITRALDTMGKLDLVARRRDENDRRNVVIKRTVKGALAVERLGDLLAAKAKELPR